MTLIEYLEAHGLTATQFSERLGCAPSTVTRWLNGARTPEDDWKEKIRDATDGAVPVTVWFDGEKLSSAGEPA